VAMEPPEDRTASPSRTGSPEATENLAGLADLPGLELRLQLPPWENLSGFGNPSGFWHVKP